LACGGRGRRVAGETAAELGVVEAASHRLVDAARRGQGAARRETESVDGLIVADARLVERAVPLEQVGLAALAVAERPRQQRRRGSLVLRDAIERLRPVRGDRVCV